MDVFSFNRYCSSKKCELASYLIDCLRTTGQGGGGKLAAGEAFVEQC